MFGEKRQGPSSTQPSQMAAVQVSPVAMEQMKPVEAPQASKASLPALAGANLPGPQAQEPEDRTPSWQIPDERDPEDYLDLPRSESPREVVDPSDVVVEESLELPVGELPMPIEGEGFPEIGQIVPEASAPVPVMKRYALPSNSTATHVVVAVPYRRAVWIISRGAGGLQASYNRGFIQPDLVDVQVNGIPIPLFAGQDLFMRVINAAAGDDLEISLIVEPRGDSR